MPVRPVNLVQTVPVMGKLMWNTKMSGLYLRHKSGMLRRKTALRVITQFYIFSSYQLIHFNQFLFQFQFN